MNLVMPVPFNIGLARTFNATPMSGSMLRIYIVRKPPSGQMFLVWTWQGGIGDLRSSDNDTAGVTAESSHHEIG